LLLVTTTSYRAQAFLEAAERLGFAVVVGSEREQALARAHPTGNLTLDFGDPEASARQVAAFAAEHRLDAVLAADDDGVPLAAWAAAALGLRHASPDAVRAARSKRVFRDRLATAGLPGPRYLEVGLDEDPAVLARRAFYPCVLKPLSLSASRGVIRADDEASFLSAFHRIRELLGKLTGSFGVPDASRTLLIEEYLPGHEVALEGLVTDGRLRTLALFDKPDPLEGPYFEETIYVTPSRLAGKVQELVQEATIAALAAIGLEAGPVHAELRVNDRGVYVLEIAPRSIGGLCSRALRFDGDQSLEELLLRHAVGEDVRRIEREPVASGVMMLPIPGAGVLRGVRGREEALRVAGVRRGSLVEVGDEELEWQ
jgi:biotin carboxylase